MCALCPRGVPLALVILLTAPAAAAPIAPEALDRLPAADVVILGEVHDNPHHHRNQARAIAALRPAAVVWEMLSPEAAARLPADLTDRDAVAAATGWAESGWPDFAMYHPIFAAAPTARHYGAEVPRDLARQAVSDGAMAVMPDGAAFGLDRPLPATEQAAREQDQHLAHCEAMPPRLLPGMVQAQRLRDAWLARAVIAALRDTGGPVAVITGVGHARRDWGLSAVLAVAAPGMQVLSIGQMEAAPGDTPPFDLWLVTDPVLRDDPCAAFR